MIFKKVIQSIFSVKNVSKHKQITILGFKIKIKHEKDSVNNYTFDAELSYDVNRSKGISVRNDWTYNIELTGQISYHILHKIKELELKRKIRNGTKVRVGFFLDTLSKFSTNSVYWVMKQNPLFEPFILLGYTYEADLENDVVWNKHLKEFNILKENGYNVFSLYDENRNYISIEKFKPDILFVTAPYLEYLGTMHLSNIFLNINYLTCHLRYGFPVSNSYIYQYNNRRINSTWKHFVFTRDEYKELMRYSQDCGINTVLTGYPKMDAYAKSIEDCKIPAKINNGNPIVIYAPHWTVVHDWEPNDFGTFNLYYKYFLDLVKKYPNINFIFKPHPSLGMNLEHNNIMSYEKYNEYIEEWERQPNGLYLCDGEYIDIFRKSSLMITDSGSFIAEYLPSNNPCMYLVKPSRNKDRYMDCFSMPARKILQKYYLCHSTEDIEHFFNMLMIEKTDPMRDERVKLKDEIFINIGSAGQNVVSYLTDLLTDNDEVKL